MVVLLPVVSPSLLVETEEVLGGHLPASSNPETRFVAVPCIS
jgi:hypothetical protein